MVAPPPGHPRFALIDSLRAIAAIAVLLEHATKVSGTADGPWGFVFYTLGQHTLAVFFVLSGFLLYRPFISAHINGAPLPTTRDYLRRRLLRIVPAYWLALTLLAIYPGLPGVFTEDWWRYYFLLTAYSGDTIPLGLLVSWTICVEVTFYLLLPLYAALMVRVGGRRDARRRVRTELLVLGGLSIVSVLVRLVDYETAFTPAIQNSLLSLFLWFAVGMGLAAVSAWAQGRRMPAVIDRLAAHPVACWGFAFALLLGLAEVMSRDGTFTAAQWVLGYYVLSAVLCAFLFLPAAFGAEYGGWPRRVLAWPPLAWLGLVSYGIYLWHVPLLGWLYGHGVHSFPALAATGLALTVVCAAMSYYAVERPILRLKYRRPGKRPRLASRERAPLGADPTAP